MSNMTPPEREAAYALDHGVSPENLQPAVKAEYIRQLEIRRAQSEGGWVCTRCGHRNPADASFCTRTNDKGVRQCGMTPPPGFVVSERPDQPDAALPADAPRPGRFPSSPETRRAILQAVAGKNGKYARPFDRGSFATVSLIGTESWSEYGGVVLQMAILDTLISIEDKLSELVSHMAPEERQL